MKLTDVALGFGGAPLGNLFARVSDHDAQAAVRHAWSSGIRYFDTAPHYGNGLSEQRIGAVLRAMPRDEFRLSTKVGRLLVVDRAAPRVQHGYVDLPPLVQRWDYSYDGTLRSFDASRQRLGLGRIDYVFIHDVASDAHGQDAPRRFREAMDGAVPALARLKAEGTSPDSASVSTTGACASTRLRTRTSTCLLVAGRYTLLDQSALPELLPLCMKRGTRVVIGGPFNSGILATGARPGRWRGPALRLRTGAGPHRGPRRRDRGRVCGASRVVEGSRPAISPCAPGGRVRVGRHAESRRDR